MKRGVWFLVLGLMGFSVACQSQTCSDCDALGAFYDSCIDELNAYGFFLMCYEEGEVNSNWYDGAGAVQTEDSELYEDWYGAGKRCENGRDVARSCEYEEAARAEAVSGANNQQNYEQQCDERDDSVASIAMRNRECIAYLEAIGLINPLP